MTAAVLPPITEAELQSLVTDFASALGWQWPHVRPGRTLAGRATSTSGPLGAGHRDLTRVRARDQRILLFELKAATGASSAAQATCHELMQSGGLDVLVVRPRDLFALLDVPR